MTGKPKTTFDLALRGERVVVEYTRDYFGSHHHSAYLSPHEPRLPHPLSETGYWSHFADKGEVEAAGGPEAYARLYAEARMTEMGGKRPKRQPPQKAEGGHAARVDAEREQKRFTQRELF